MAGQANKNGMHEADLPDHIKAQPASTSPNQSESPAIEMPPKTRSQTSRSHATTNPSGLATLPEDIESLDIKDDAPIPPPAEESRQANVSVVPTTPKHRKIASSVQSSQREGALAADPNDGRCFLTNQPRTAAVQLCHLLARSTDHATLTKLEYVWGFGYRQLHVDTKRNLMFLRADWHILFDTNNWLLIPENEVLQKLSKIYLEDKCSTSDITKLFANETYRYYVVPLPTLEVPICHFPEIGSRDHDTHFPPFPDLGLLEGHFHPYFVVVNSGKKLTSFGSRVVGDIILTLSRIISPSDAISIVAIQHLYEEWMGVKVPDHYHNASGPSKRLFPPGEGQDDHSRDGSPPRREGLRSGTRSQPSRASDGQYAGGQQRAVFPIQSPDDDDDSSITNDTVVEEDIDWIEYIHSWQKQGDGAEEGVESDVLDNVYDKQLAAYKQEHARTPPSPAFWDSWKPAWDDRESRYSSTSDSDRSQFSSNDWAVFKRDIYLPRNPERPRV